MNTILGWLIFFSCPFFLQDIFITIDVKNLADRSIPIVYFVLEQLYVTPVQEEFEMNDREPLVTVITATNPGLLAVIKSVLDDADIPCITQGEGFQVLYAAGPVEVLVFESDAEQARALLKGL